MMLGATLFSGIGQWIVLFPAGLIVLEVKIHTLTGYQIPEKIC